MYYGFVTTHKWLLFEVQYLEIYFPLFETHDLLFLLVSCDIKRTFFVLSSYLHPVWYLGREGYCFFPLHSF